MSSNLVSSKIIYNGNGVKAKPRSIPLQLILFKLKGKLNKTEAAKELPGIVQT